MKRKISLMLVFTFFTTSVFGNQFVTKDKCPFLTDNELTDADFQALKSSFKNSMCELQSTLENCQAALKNQEANATCANGELTGSTKAADRSSKLSSSIKDVADLLVNDYRKINCRNLESSLIGMQEDYWNSYFNTNSTIRNAEQFFNNPAPEGSWGYIKTMIEDVPSQPEKSNYSFHAQLLFLKEAPFSISDMSQPQEIYSTCHTEFARGVKAVFNDVDTDKLDKYFKKEGLITKPAQDVAIIKKMIADLKEEKNIIDKEIKKLNQELASLSVEDLLRLSIKITSGQNYRASLDNCNNCETCTKDIVEDFKVVKINICEKISEEFDISATTIRDFKQQLDNQLRLLIEEKNKLSQNETKIEALEKLIEDKNDRVAAINEKLDKLNSVPVGDHNDDVISNALDAITVVPLVQKMKQHYESSKEQYKECMIDKAVTLRNLATQRCHNISDNMVRNSAAITSSLEGIATLIDQPKKDIAECIAQLEALGKGEEAIKVKNKHIINKASEAVSNIATTVTAVLPNLNPASRVGIQAANSLQKSIFQGGSRNIAQELKNTKKVLNGIDNATVLIPSYKCNFYNFNRILAKSTCSNDAASEKSQDLNQSGSCQQDFSANTDALFQIENFSKNITEFLVSIDKKSKDNSNEENEDKPVNFDRNVPLSLNKKFTKDSELAKLLPTVSDAIMAEVKNKDSKVKIIEDNPYTAEKLARKFKLIHEIVTKSKDSTVPIDNIIKDYKELDKELLMDPTLSVDLLQQYFNAIETVDNTNQGYQKLLKNIKYSQMLKENSDQFKEITSNYNERETTNDYTELYKKGFIYLHGGIIKNNFIKRTCTFANQIDFKEPMRELYKMCLYNQSAFFWDVDIPNGNDDFRKLPNERGIKFFNQVCDIFRSEKCQKKNIRMPSACNKSKAGTDVSQCEANHQRMYCQNDHYKDISTLLSDMFGQTADKQPTICGLSPQELKDARDNFQKALTEYKASGKGKDSDFKGCKEDGHSTKEFNDDPQTDPRIQNPGKPVEDFNRDKKSPSNV